MEIEIQMLFLNFETIIHFSTSTFLFYFVDHYENKLSSFFIENASMLFTLYSHGHRLHKFLMIDLSCLNNQSFTNLIKCRSFAN